MLLTVHQTEKLFASEFHAETLYMFYVMYLFYLFHIPK